MARKISLAHLSCLPWTPAEMVYNAKTIGFDYVSIRNISMGTKADVDYDFDRHPEHLANLKRAMEETGVGVHDIEIAKIDDAADISTYESAFAYGQELGAKSVITSIWTSNSDLGQKKYEQVCDLAAKYNLFVGFEFVTWASVWDLKGAAEVIRKGGRSNAGLLVDTLHAYRSGVTPAEIAACPKEWLEFAHICGGPREIPPLEDKEALIFNGRERRYYLTEPDMGIPVADYIRAMPEDTVLSMELPNLKVCEECGIFEHVQRIYKTTRAYLAENGLE